MMMISALHLSDFANYHSMTFVAVASIVALLFFVVSTVVIPFSQLVIAQKYALHDDNNNNNNHNLNLISHFFSN